MIYKQQNKISSDVYIYDPTPGAIKHVNYIRDLFVGKMIKRYGGGDINYLNILEKNKINSERWNII